MYMYVCICIQNQPGTRTDLSSFVRRGAHLRTGRSLLGTECVTTSDMYIYIYMYIYIHTYIHIYIYI